jgi:hypothetical protein
MLEYYKPKRSVDVIGNKKEIDYLREYLKSFDLGEKNPNKPNLIIIGEHGIGKKLIVNLLLNELDFVKMVPSINSLGGKVKSAENYYHKLCNQKNLFDYSNYNRVKIALVVDDIENISNKGEKDIIKKLIKINIARKKIPIIIITTPGHNKMITNLKKGKSIETLFLYPPSYDNLENYIKHVGRNEHMIFAPTLGIANGVIDRIIEHSQNDVRRLIFILEELKHLFKTELITVEKFNDYMQSSMKKNIDLGIFESTRLLLNDYVNMEEAQILYETDRSTIPLIFHENYLSNISKQYEGLNIEDKMNMICEISRCMSEGDKIEGIIYSHQSWNLQNVHGFLTCVAPSYLINSFDNKTCKRETYEYTKDFNKTSIMKINKKVILNVKQNSYMQNMDIHDFVYLNNIIKNLINAKRYDEIKTLIGDYKWKTKQFESLLKIDKTNIYPVSLQKKTKITRRTKDTGLQNEDGTKVPAPVATPAPQNNSVLDNALKKELYPYLGLKLISDKKKQGKARKATDKNAVDEEESESEDEVEDEDDSDDESDDDE